MASIEKRGNSYLIRVSDGYGMDKKQLRCSMTWKPEPGMKNDQIEKEVVRQAVLFEEKVKTDQIISSGITFAEFSKRWFELYAEKSLAPKTVNRYQDLLIRINKNIGHIRIDRVRPNNLIKLYADLAQTDKTGSVRYLFNDLGLVIKTRKLTLSELSNRSNVSINTLRSAVAGKPVTKQTANKISAVLSLKLADSTTTIKTGQKLSDQTILHHHRLVSSILQTAVQWQVIANNPASRIKPPKVDHKEKAYLDEVQTKLLIEKLSSEPIQFKTMIILLIFAGNEKRRTLWS